jgi:hypothetical protein
VLTTDTETPVVTQTTVSADLLQALKVIAELRVDTVGEDLRVLAIDNVALSVEEPSGDLVLGGVLDDGDNTLKLLRGELTGAVKISSVFLLLHISLVLGLASCVVHRLWGCAYRLFRSTSAFLQTRLE